MKKKKSADYSLYFSDKSFWQKVRKFAASAGRDVIEKGVALYYTARDPKTPVWAKTAIASSLGYFIFPLDAIPDVVPVVGFADDLGVLSAAVATVAVHVTPQHWKEARSQVRQWFGPKRKGN